VAESYDSGKLDAEKERDMPKEHVSTSPAPRFDEAEVERIGRACVASGIGIYEFDIDRRQGIWGLGIAELLGLEGPRGSVDLEMVAGTMHPDHRDGGMRQIRQAMETPGDYDMRHLLVRPDGQSIWVRDRGRIYSDVDERGQITRRAVGTLIDTTAQVEAERRLNTIAGEMQHRLKNLLTVVTSLVRLMRPAPAEQFRAALIGRLRSLAASQTLADEAMGGVELRALCQSQLAPVWDDLDRRLSLCGESAILRPEAAEAIGMALYELLTNAMKYGALSSERGRVSVSWSRGNDRFLVSWREEGGRPPDSDAEPGFGTHVIRDFVAAALGGNVEIETCADGLLWRLDAPAANVLAP
jgi:two-component system CheB/CheR fusion protein